MKDRHETPEEKKIRLEKHEHYMKYILIKNFKRKFSEIFKSEFFVCKSCDATLHEEKDAINHYFDKHREKKGNKDEQKTQKTK